MAGIHPPEPKSNMKLRTPRIRDQKPTDATKQLALAETWKALTKSSRSGAAWTFAKLR